MLFFDRLDRFFREEGGVANEAKAEGGVPDAEEDEVAEHEDNAREEVAGGVQEDAPIILEVDEELVDGAHVLTGAGAPAGHQRTAAEGGDAPAGHHRSDLRSAIAEARHDYLLALPPMGHDPTSPLPTCSLPV